MTKIKRTKTGYTVYTNGNRQGDWFNRIVLVPAYIARNLTHDGIIIAAAECDSCRVVRKGWVIS